MNFLHVNGTISSTRIDGGTIFSKLEDKKTFTEYHESFSDDTADNVLTEFCDYFKQDAMSAKEAESGPDRIFGTRQVARFSGTAHFYKDGICTHAVSFGRTNDDLLFYVDSAGEFASCHIDMLEAGKFFVDTISTYMLDHTSDIDYAIMTIEVDLMGEEFYSLRTTRLFIS